MITACDVSYGLPLCPRQKLQRPDNSKLHLLLRALIAIFLDIFPENMHRIVVLKKGSRQPRLARFTRPARAPRGSVKSRDISGTGHSLSAICCARKTAKTRIALSRSFARLLLRIIESCQRLWYSRYLRTNAGKNIWHGQIEATRAAQQIFFVASLEIREENTARNEEEYEGKEEEEEEERAKGGRFLRSGLLACNEERINE